MSIKKVVILHQSTGEREEYATDTADEAVLVNAYSPSLPDIGDLQIKPGRVIAAVQLLPSLEELFIQTWDVALWLSINKQEQRKGEEVIAQAPVAQA